MEISVFSAADRSAPSRLQRDPFKISVRKTKFVEQWPHSGQMINKRRNDDKDVFTHKNSLIGHRNNLISNLLCLDSLTTLFVSELLLQTL
jgi:hypothetical protein